jgi:hypothetical protein
MAKSAVSKRIVRRCPSVSPSISRPRQRLRPSTVRTPPCHPLTFRAAFIWRPVRLSSHLLVHFLLFSQAAPFRQHRSQRSPSCLCLKRVSFFRLFISSNIFEGDPPCSSARQLCAALALAAVRSPHRSRLRIRLPRNWSVCERHQLALRWRPLPAIDEGAVAQPVASHPELRCSECRRWRIVAQARRPIVSALCCLPLSSCAAPVTWSMAHGTT